jgi:TPR repeat protein
MGAERATWLPRAILRHVLPMYYKGRGVCHDLREAFRLKTLAAETKFRLGAENVGDYVQAHKWLNLSTAQGDKEAGTLRDELAKTIPRIR